MTNTNIWLHVVNNMDGGVGSVVNGLIDAGIAGYAQDVLVLPSYNNRIKHYYFRRKAIISAISHLPANSVVHFHTGIRSWIYYFRREGIKRLVTLHGILPTNGLLFLLTRIESILLTLAFNNIIAVSESCRSDFRSLSFKNSDVDVVYNGVGICNDSNSLRNSNCSNWKIIFVAGLWKNKGIKIFLDTVTLLKDKPISFEVYGNGPEAHLVQKACAVHDNIRWFHNVNNKSLIYLGKDILLFPSEHEGCPMAILEAMGYGVLCIANNIMCIREIIDNGNDGILISNRSAADYASAIENMINNPLEFYIMRLTAQSKCKNKFNARLMAYNYYQIIN